MHYSSILPDVLQIADAASEKVLHVYQSDFKVRHKADDSPITAADEASHEVIVAGLNNISRDIPVLSEEGAAIPWSERKSWHRFWLVDPVDGTREFTQRSGEFTVNIALIEFGEPVLGVITVPALKEAYWGAKGEGAFKRDRTGKVHRIRVATPKDEVRVLASKNHLNPETRAFIDTLGPHEMIQAGSSLKFCRIAEGHADLYPRLGPTSEWDTAAGHAILLAAGGTVNKLNGEPMTYGKEDLINPHFVASGR